MKIQTFATNVSFPSLSGEEIHVWNIQKIENIDSCLDANEHAKIESFKNEAARKSYALSRAALRKISSEYVGKLPTKIRIDYEQNGKPFFPEEELHFNTSHSGNLVVIAFSRHTALGIDIESGGRLRKPLDLARRFFSPEEVAHLQKEADEEGIARQFLRYWVCKEAALKSSGHGLTGGLENTRVDLGGDGPTVLHRGIDGRRLNVLEFVPAEGFQGALVSERPFLREKVKWFVL